MHDQQRGIAEPNVAQDPEIDSSGSRSGDSITKSWRPATVILDQETPPTFPFCDLPIFGDSGKDARVAPFLSLSLTLPPD